MSTATILHQSNSNEWYTPRHYVDAARELMEGIDLDPASSEAANRLVQAANFYTIEHDGLAQPWRGRVWLNPPYGRSAGVAESNQARWSRRLVESYRAGQVTQAVLLVNATPSNRWFTPLWDFPICFTDHRIRFLLPSGKPANAPTHSNALIYFGQNNARFRAIFSRFGTVAVRMP